MNEITRTLDQVTAEIKYLDRQIGRLVMGHALEIGRRLTEAKTMVPYGGWGDYLKNELGYTQTTANKLMKVFEEYGASQMGLFGPELESETFTNLTYSKALALLAIPREERESFAEEVDAEHISVRELEKAIKERDEAKKQLAEVNRAFEASQDAINERDGKLQERDAQIYDMKAELTELKNRPVEVAVQQPDPAEIERRAQELAKDAEAKAKKQVSDAQAKAKQEVAIAKLHAEEELVRETNKLKSAMQELKKKLEASEAKAKEAGNTEEADALRAQVETMRKRLAMSEESAVTFKLRFQAWNDSYRALSEALEMLPEEKREKLRVAVKTQAKAWAEG